jgi:hypothetical protein
MATASAKTLDPNDFAQLDKQFRETDRCFAAERRVDYSDLIAFCGAVLARTKAQHDKDAAWLRTHDRQAYHEQWVWTERALTSNDLSCYHAAVATALGYFGKVNLAQTEAHMAIARKLFQALHSKQLSRDDRRFLARVRRNAAMLEGVLANVKSTT